MPTFPISSASGLGLGGVGGGTQAPALVQGVGLTVNQNGAPSSAVWLFPWSASDPTALTGQVPAGLVFGLGDYAGQIYAVDDAGAPVMVIDNGALVGTLVVDSLDLGDNDPINFGDADDIAMKWNGSYFAVTQATPNSQIRLGISGAGIDLQLFGDTVGADCLWDQSANTLLFGTGAILDISAGTLTAGSMSAVGIANTSTLNQDAIIDQDTADTTGTGAAFDSLGTSTSATGSYAIIKGTFQQITNAKTAGVGFGVQGTYVGLAGDTSGALVGGLYAAAPTLNGGSPIAAGLAIAAGYTDDIYFADTSAVITFQDAAGSGLTIRDAGGNAFLAFDSAAVDGITLGNATTNPVLTVLGTGGTDVSAGTLTAGAVMVSGTATLSDGSLLLQVGAGTGTGDKIACLGVDATHGIATYVYQDTVSPAAIETNLFTIPAMSVVDSVQANVQSALTGGGTTVTFSVGITGDVDAYGTASNSGVQADLLTQNAKINTLGTTTNAGASIGVWSAGTVSLKLIGAATGGAAAGDTALTVGSVLVRVVYRTLLPLADA